MHHVPATRSTWSCRRIACGLSAGNTQRFWAPRPTMTDLLVRAHRATVRLQIRLFETSVRGSRPHVAGEDLPGSRVEQRQTNDRFAGHSTAAHSDPLAVAALERRVCGPRSPFPCMLGERNPRRDVVLIMSSPIEACGRTRRRARTRRRGSPVRQARSNEPTGGRPRRANSESQVALPNAANRRRNRHKRSATRAPCRSALQSRCRSPALGVRLVVRRACWDLRNGQSQGLHARGGPATRPPWPEIAGLNQPTCATMEPPSRPPFKPGKIVAGAPVHTRRAAEPSPGRARRRLGHHMAIPLVGYGRVESYAVIELDRPRARRSRQVERANARANCDSADPRTSRPADRAQRPEKDDARMRRAARRCKSRLVGRRDFNSTGAEVDRRNDGLLGDARRSGSTAS